MGCCFIYTNPTEFTLIYLLILYTFPKCLPHSITHSTHSSHFLSFPSSKLKLYSSSNLKLYHSIFNFIFLCEFLAIANIEDEYYFSDNELDEIMNLDPVDTDWSGMFVTDEVFSDRESLIKYVREVGRPHNMVFTIERLKKGRIWLQCERGGAYRRQPTVNPDSARSTRSKKCGCEFRIRGMKTPYYGWTMVVECGVHNHSLGKYLQGNSFACQLLQKERRLVNELTLINVKPKEILNQLKRNNENCTTTLKTIYNARYKFKMESMEGRTVIQQLLHFLEQNDYVYWHRRFPESDVISDIVFSHPDSIGLLHAFPYVICLDCTYKTNRSNLPFLEIIGFINSGKNFTVAMAFMGREKEDNYEWVLNKVKKMMEPHEPNVVITDRELALTKIVSKVFPNAAPFLCRWHISKNVTSRATKKLGTVALGESFARTWDRVVRATTLHTYHNELLLMQEKWGRFPHLIQYVYETWLNPYKERLWQFGSTTFFILTRILLTGWKVNMPN